LLFAEFIGLISYRFKLWVRSKIVARLLAVFVRRDKHGSAELVLLDHGLYDYLNDRDRVSLCQLYKAIVLHDDELMKRHSLQLGVQGEAC